MWQDFVEIDSFSYERRLIRHGILRVAGTDEAGRGPLAGPVVAACVVLPPDIDWSQFKDSKKLTPKARAGLFSLLKKSEALIGVGICSAAEIDQHNILQASLLAMKKAAEDLPECPEYLLVDGKFTVPMSIEQQALIKGETRSASIAAASIVAKEIRDKIMAQYAVEFPLYEFAKHKGYPTALHRSLIERHGPCEIHRRTFKGVKEFIQIS